MSSALSVCHGTFGRAAIYHLDKSLITHAHREGQLIFHVDGSFSDILINDMVFTVDHDRVAAVSPFEPHSVDLKSSDMSVVLMLYLNPTWFLGNRLSGEFPLRFGCPVIKRTQAIDSVLHQLTSLLLDSNSIENNNSLLLTLCRLCYEQSWTTTKSLNAQADAGSISSDYRIKRALKLMNGSISAALELETVARKVGLSRPHFFKLFKQQMGVTPNVYMNTLRSERAIDDLVNTDKSVTHIARELGYSSQASFTRFFSSNVGIAPSEYRRSLISAR